MITELNLRIPTQDVPNQRDYSKKTARTEPTERPRLSIQELLSPRRVQYRIEPAPRPTPRLPSRPPVELAIPQRALQQRPANADEIDAMVQEMVSDGLVVLDIPADQYRLKRERKYWRYEP